MVLALLQAGGRLEERALVALRWVLFTEEAFPTKHPRTLMERLHPCYANLYGPTETNVCAYYEVEPLSLEQTVPIPIGKACANTDFIPINAEGKESSQPTRKAFFTRGHPPLCKVTTAALRPVWSLMLGGLYGRCDLARQKPAGAHS